MISSLPYSDTHQFSGIGIPFCTFKNKNLENLGADVSHWLCRSRPGPSAQRAGLSPAVCQPVPPPLPRPGRRDSHLSDPAPPRAPNTPAREDPPRATARRHPAQADSEVSGLSHTERPPSSASPHTESSHPDAPAAGPPARPTDARRLCATCYAPARALDPKTSEKEPQSRPRAAFEGFVIVWV